jgi:hypothetical protein
MGPAFYVLAILGCGEGETACQQVGKVETRYESLEACNAATAMAVSRHIDLAFPVVAAQCQREDQEIAQQVMPRDLDLPSPDGEPRRVQRAHYQPPKKLKL